MWRVIPGQCLRYRAWDDEFVLYNDLSGDTHLLGASALHVLLALKDGARDQQALARSLGAAFEPEQGEADAPAALAAELADEVAELVASLTALSLIERTPC